ncbi:hypothetical protein IV83_GL001175 [Pediococcus inopinatus]|nr:hypothetical protein IV83_GL001175 [Pediococcus inopinatus]
MLSVAMSHGDKIAIVTGIIVLMSLFSNLIISFIKFCFQHPYIFILMLLFSGLGFSFNLLLGYLLAFAAVIIGITFFMRDIF